MGGSPHLRIPLFPAILLGDLLDTSERGNPWTASLAVVCCKEVTKFLAN
jgi:hypothetical protein